MLISYRGYISTRCQKKTSATWYDWLVCKYGWFDSMRHHCFADCYPMAPPSEIIWICRAFRPRLAPCIVRSLSSKSKVWLFSTAIFSLSNTTCWSPASCALTLLMDTFVPSAWCFSAICRLGMEKDWERKKRERRKSQVYLDAWSVPLILIKKR